MSDAGYYVLSAGLDVTIGGVDQTTAEALV